MTVVIPICESCIYYFGLTHCAAFGAKTEIPEEILGGKSDHSQAMEGDHGIQYLSAESVSMDERVKLLADAFETLAGTT